MNHFKLIQLLRILNAEELRKLHKFLRSPYFNYSQPILLLCEELRKFHPDFDAPSFHSEKIWKKLYPDEPFNDKNFRKWIFKLTQLVERFLAIEEMEANTTKQSYFVMRALEKRDASPLFFKAIQALEQQLEKSPYKDDNYYCEQIQLLEHKYFHPKFNKYNTKDRTLEKLMDAVDAYFGTAKLRYGLALKNKIKILKTPYQFRFMEALFEEADFLKESPTFRLLFMSMQLLEGADFSFEEYENDLFEHLPNIRLESQRLLFFNGLNYAIRQVNKGVEQFSSSVLKWYKTGLENDLLFQNGTLSHITFGNIVLYGCRERELEWTKQFIENHRNYLEEKQKEDTINYNAGLLLFHEKKYEEALSVLNQYPFGISYKIKSKVFIIRVLFELFLQNADYYDTLMATCKAFESFSNRNKNLSKNKLETHISSIRLIEKFAKKVMRRENLKSLEQWFERELDENQNLSLKRWFYQKLETLKNEFSY